MTDEYRVKGSSIRSKFEFVHDRFGEAAERRLKERFRDHGILPVLDSVMYPFAEYDAVNRAIAEEFLDGDLTRLAEVGAYSAQKVLTGVYRAFAAVLVPQGAPRPGARSTRPFRDCSAAAERHR